MQMFHIALRASKNKPRAKIITKAFPKILIGSKKPRTSPDHYPDPNTYGNKPSNNIHSLYFVRIFRLQECQQHSPHGMVNEPFTNLLDVFIIIAAKFFQIDVVQMIFGFKRT